MNGPVSISAGQLALAASLLLVNAGLSWWLSLGLGRKLVVAALRTVVQLTLLGYVLVPVFEVAHPALTLAVGMTMVVLASFEGLKRVGFRYRGSRVDSFVALLVASSVTTWFGTALVVSVEPWWTPRYLIPLLGMVLGNALTGISLGLDRGLRQIYTDATSIEAWLALGATRREAAMPVLADALRTGLVPILNSMSIVGLITIPGMMTGQLLGGTPPALAARYQIVIMFLISAATALGVGLTVALSLRRLFDSEQRLRLDRLHKR